MTNPVLLPALLTLATPTSASAPPAAGPPARTVSYEGIGEYRFDNGLKLLLIPDASQPTVTVNLTIFAGSAVEDYGETGAAHLLEHLCFKGSPDFPNVPGALNEHGATFNGTTWTDRTNYFETMPAGDANLDFGVHFEAARLMRSFIRKSDLDSEMTVVRNEFERGENDPTEVLSERMLSTAYLFHGYQHATIGARSDVEQVPIERLQGFYRKWYRPDNALLIIAGRFDEKKALDSVARHFGTLARPAVPLLAAYTAEPAQDGERAVTLRRVGEVGAAGVVYHIPAGSHPDAAAVEVLAQILATAPSGRLYKALVETKKAVSVTADPFQWRDPSVLQIMAQVRKEGSLEGVRDEMLAVAEGVGASEPTVEEVERAQNAILKAKTLLFAKSDRLAVEMSEWAAMGDWRLFFVHKERIGAVTPADVRRVARHYLRAGNRTVGLYVPSAAAERIEVPAAPDPGAAIAGLPSRDGGALAAETLDLDAVKLEARTRRTSVPESGIKLALLAKDTRGDAVSGAISIIVGNSVDLQDLLPVNSYVAQMLRRGTTRHSRAQIKDELDRLQAEVQVSGGANLTTVSFTTTRDGLPGVAALVFEMLREPAFEEKELELLRQEEIARLEESSHEPQALAANGLAHHLFPPGHISYTPTVADQLAFVKGLKAETLRAFHRDFYGAGEGWVAVVGDFDDAAFEKGASAALSGWTSVKAARRADPTWPGPTRSVVQAIEAPDKENALTVAGVTFPLRRDAPEYAPLLVANYLTGGEPLNSRLAARLRQKDGLCYGVGASAGADPRSELGTFSFYAISAPQNAERVEQGFREELARARKDGYSAEEVARARAAYLERLDTQLARDSSLAREMITMMVRGRTFDDLGELRARIQAVTPEAVNEATRKYFDPAAMSLFRAGDFARAKKGEEAPAAVSTKPKR